MVRLGEVFVFSDIVFIDEFVFNLICLCICMCICVLFLMCNYVVLDF